ncbi:MAG TPA: outer membrane protein assembly factor BamA [Longimicrobiaceae bacterium]|nr:outer membrane protein assembly factor BamA [Longimicrobiaceae bacterium]
MLSYFNGGRAAAAALLAFGLGALAPRAAHAQDTPAQPATAAPDPGVVVDSVLVTGARRVPAASVRSTAGIQPRQTVTAVQVQAAIRRLMASQAYDRADVLVRETGNGHGVVTLQVAERPWIAQVEFRGLKSLSGNATRDSSGLKEGAPLNPQRVKDAERLVRDNLAKKGIQLVSIDTSLVAMPQAADGYKLVFNVREGSRLTLADVDFQGNQAFTDEELTGAMKTKPEGFWWFRSGRFDREAFETDLRESLPGFYADRGYIDFQVLGDTLMVDPATGAARLVVDVSEGQQYRLGEFIIQGASHFPHEALERLFLEQHRSVLGLPVGGTTQRMAGQVFDQGALDAAAKQIQQMYRNEGYLYAQVVPSTERVEVQPGQPPRVNATIAVSERQPFYVRHISFEGNSTTHEQVMRDRLWLLPGDVYDEQRLIQSYQALGGLGFFETPMPTPSINPNPDSGTVDIVFHVKEKQTGNINFGTVIGGGYAGRGGGVSGFLGYNQPNLFGQGKNASLRVEYGYGRSTLEASYTDPALGGSRTSGSFSVFRTGDRFISTNNGRRLRTGASVSFGFPLPGAPRTRVFTGYTLSRTTYTAFEDPCAGQTTNVFCLPAATASQLSLSLVRDTKNHPLFPTSGTRQSISVSQTGGPLGGNGNFQKVLGEVEWWVPAGQIGTGVRPIRFAWGLNVRGGTVFGDVSRFPFEKFYVGGVQQGEPLRGYGEFTVGPRGYLPECKTRLTTECLGESFVTVSAEYAVRLSDMISLHVFGDAGNVFSDVQEFNPTRLFRGAGVGGTIVTPFLGAIGVDAAYGFDRPIPGWEIHFKLGTGF